MGKASRTKRERQASGGKRPGGLDTKAAQARGAQRKPFPVFWTILGVIAVGGIVAMVMTSGTKDSASQTAAKSAPVFSVISTTGSPLRPLAGSGKDAAVGKSIPTITGTGFDEKERTISADDGVPRVLVVVAHWCEHCQKEVPRIVAWAKEGKLPPGVEVTAIATSSGKGRPNFPPAAWLATEDWPYDTIADDEVGSAALALGTSGFPHLVFVNADGTVAKRASGEQPIDEFDADVKAIAKTAAAAK